MSRSLSVTAHARITQMILSRALPPGAALQEARLAEELGMSRTPVREAMRRIEAEGLALREGRALRVRLLGRREVEEIFTLRTTLEGFAARLAVSLPADDVAGMEARVRAIMASGPGEGEDQRAVDEAFHAMIARASGNMTLVRTVSELRLRTCMFDVHQVPHRFLAGSQEHLDILAALSRGEGEAAQTLMEAHVRHAGEAILDRLKALEAGA